MTAEAGTASGFDRRPTAPMVLGALRNPVNLPGREVASAADGAFFAHGAGTAGLHRFADFLLVVAALLLAVILVDRSPTRIGAEPKGAPA